MIKKEKPGLLPGIVDNSGSNCACAGDPGGNNACRNGHIVHLPSSGVKRGQSLSPEFTAAVATDATAPIMAVSTTGFMVSPPLVGFLWVTSECHDRTGCRRGHCRD